MPMTRQFAAALLTIAMAGAGFAQPSVAPGTILDAGAAADGRWHWITVDPATSSATSWITQTGEATVTIDHGVFHAELRQPLGQPGADITLNGRISGTRIRAQEVLLNTDASPMTITGKLKRIKLGATIEERVAFHGGQSGEASFLGLARRVKP